MNSRAPCSVGRMSILQTTRCTKILEGKFRAKIFYSHLKLKFTNTYLKNGGVV
jgi:hypothetical protein